MLISEVVDGIEFAPEHPELLGKRILITGIRGALGIEIARAFSEARTRLVLHAIEEGPETTALGELVAAHAMDVRLFTGAFADNQATLEFARSAIQAFGGIDAVINIVEVSAPPVGAHDAQRGHDPEHRRDRARRLRHNAPAWRHRPLGTGRRYAGRGRGGSPGRHPHQRDRAGGVAG